MKEQFDELRIYQDQKKVKLIEVDKIESQIQALEREKAKELKKVHPIYNSAEKLKAGLKELNRR